MSMNTIAQLFEDKRVVFSKYDATHLFALDQAITKYVDTLGLLDIGGILLGVGVDLAKANIIVGPDGRPFLFDAVWERVGQAARNAEPAHAEQS